MQENPLKFQNAIYNIGDPFPQWSQMTMLLRQLLWPCHFNIGCLFGPITLTVNYSFFLYGRLNVIVIPLPFHYEGSLDPLFYYFNKLWDALFSLTTLSEGHGYPCHFCPLFHHLNRPVSNYQNSYLSSRLRAIKQKKWIFDPWISMQLLLFYTS